MRAARLLVGIACLGLTGLPLGLVSSAAAAPSDDSSPASAGTDESEQRRRGIAVVSLVDGEAGRSAARALYVRPRLTPGFENDVAEQLVGSASGSYADQRAALRSVDPSRTLGSPLDQAMQSLSDQLRTDAIFLIHAATPGGEVQPDAVVASLWIRGSGFSPVTFAPHADGGGTDWSQTPEAVIALLPPPTEPEAKRAAKPPPPTKPPPPLAPTVEPSAPAPPVPKDADASGQWYENPWFWGSAGAVAAIGVTVFVLAVTTQDDAGTIRIDGSIAP